MCSLGSSRRIWRAFFAPLTYIAIACVVTVLGGCAAAPKQVVTDEAVSFEVAMDQIAKDLVQQVQDGTGIKAVIARIESQLRQTIVVVDPFIDAQNGYAVVAGKRAQTEIADKAKAAVKSFEFYDLTTDALAKSNFVMSGTIGFESKANTAKKLYRVHVALTNSKTGAVAAQSSAWLSDANIDMKPLPVYQESPVFLNDRYSRGLVQTSVAAVGQNAEATYFSQLATAALQAEAQQAYATDDTKTSLSLYQRAETRNDGKTLKIYSGLYVSHLKLGNLADAEKTFGQLVAVAFAENNLSIRFLFQVNSTDFINEPKLNQQYRIWVRQLGQHISKSQQCVEVQGHSSKSGNEAYNNRLSLQRAEFIRRQMQLDSSASVNLTKATGRGFQDNLVGSGSDNEQDAIDRRVEFKIIPCSQNRGG
jgi:outer membrane protein OmpA-like peptidoglycan-associated protein